MWRSRSAVRPWPMATPPLRCRSSNVASPPMRPQPTRGSISDRRTQRSGMRRVPVRAGNARARSIRITRAPLLRLATAPGPVADERLCPAAFVIRSQNWVRTQFGASRALLALIATTETRDRNRNQRNWSGPSFERATDLQLTKSRDVLAAVKRSLLHAALAPFPPPSPRAPADQWQSDAATALPARRLRASGESGDCALR